MKPQILLPPPQSTTGPAPVQLQPPLSVQPPVTDSIVLPTPESKTVVPPVELPKVTQSVVVQSVPNGGLSKEVNPMTDSPSRKRSREEMSVDSPDETVVVSGDSTITAETNELVEPA